MSVAPERWQRVKSLMLRAAEHADPASRAAFLEQACGGDAELKRQVETLLEADRSAADFLEQPVLRAVPPAGEPEPLHSVGPYEILRPLGRGGMGTVYLAVREGDEYRNRVAVKVLRPGLTGEWIIRRFRSEGDILASLDHPNIARLLDGGTTREGRPYLVMEYVEGQPIDRYCRDRVPSVAERLKLFRRVCAAVRFAHRSLVVHRDLKPSNILVTEGGVPKLLDFGIAKLLRAEGVDRTIDSTATALRLMTPEYAAPEQVRGETITTATDVYSLGLVLYQLLTGRRPFNLKSHDPAEVLHAVCERQLEKPSIVVYREPGRDGEPAGSSKRRDRRRLSRRLKGDLDNIVLKAVRKEPERRYRSVEQLSEDLRRHLTGLPVSARRGTLAYRAGRFLRRYRAGVAATAAIVLLILAFALSMAIQRQQIARQRDRAERVTELLVGMLEAADPDAAKGNAVTVREVLERSAERIDEQLSDQPELRAILLEVMGRVYVNLGLYDAATELLEEALGLRHRLLGMDHPDVASSLHHLGSALRQRGDLRASEPLLREALALRRQSRASDPRELEETLNELALLYNVEGDYDAAEEIYRQLLAMGGRTSRELAPLYNNLGLALAGQGELGEAQRLLRRAVALSREVHGGLHSDVAANLNNLARILMRQGKTDEAEPLLREALGLRREIFGEHHPDVAVSLYDLAELVHSRGDPATAGALFRQALEITVRHLGRENRYVARILNSLARALADQGDYSESEALAREALTLRRELLNADHPSVSVSLDTLASVLMARGRFAAAEPLLREVLQLARRQVPEDRRRVIGAQRALGACLTRLERYAEAEALLLDSHAAALASESEGMPSAAEIARSLGELYEAWGKTPAIELLSPSRAKPGSPGIPPSRNVPEAGSGRVPVPPSCRDFVLQLFYRYPGSGSVGYSREVRRPCRALFRPPRWLATARDAT